MAPHDQHSVVTGLAWVTTNAPLDLPFVFSVRVISVFQFSPDMPRLSEFQSNRTSVLNSLRLGGFRLRRDLRKRTSAAARFLRIRIPEFKALVHQALFVIENHSVQVDERFRI